MKSASDVKDKKPIHGIRKNKLKKAKQMWPLYLLLLAPVALVFVFKYIPMYGILMAFKDYTYRDGIWGSAWNDFEHFKNLFNSFSFLRVFRNTLIISVLR